MSNKFGGNVTGEVLTSGAPDILDNLASNFSGILSTKPTARFASGARTTLKINGKLIGFAFSISWNITTSQDEINTIDDYTTYEFAPKRIHVEGSIGMLHLPGSGASAQLIQPNMLSFLAHKYITIEVRDSATDELLFYTTRAVITGRSEDVRSEQLSTVSLNWKATSWQDEIYPKMPDGINQTSKSDTGDTNGLTALASAVGDLFSGGSSASDGNDQEGGSTSGGSDSSPAVDLQSIGSGASLSPL